MANNLPSSGAQPFHPPIVGAAGSQGYGPPMSMQFRPAVMGQQGQSYIPVGSQQHHPGQGIPPSLQSQPVQFSQPMQQLLPPRPGQHAQPGPSLQAVPMPYNQPSRPYVSDSNQSQQTTASHSNHMPGLSGPGMPISSSYTFAPTSFAQQQNNINQSMQFQPMSQMHAPPMPVGGQPWLSSGSTTHITPLQQAGQQSSVSGDAVSASNVSNTTQQASDWQEHISADGRRYYYDKVTRRSSWDKPYELMSPIEKADASTIWKEFTTPDGRKYYHNRHTKESTWTLPEDLKLARVQAERVTSQGTQPDVGSSSHTPVAVAVSSVETPTATMPVSPGAPPAVPCVSSSPVPVIAVATSSDSPAVPVSGSLELPNTDPSATNTVEPSVAAAPVPGTADSAGVSASLENGGTSQDGHANLSQDVRTSMGGASVEDIEEAKRGMAVAGKINTTPVEEKAVDEEPLIYANKMEAKSAFKALLESANVESDWTWDQTMRVIINDKRYGALKTLGERKQAFNEYLGQRKKVEVEERRLRQRKAREEFVKMLEESKELTSATRWSKAVMMFEDDERFKAVERPRDREDLFHNYLDELQEKEKVKAKEELEQNRSEYRKFLESCDFIKVNSQWRKVQDRLEDDERCSRLEKIERLQVFQEYIRDLEKEEEELKKMQKDQLRRSERKNRDQFRKMLEEHVAAGALTAKTHWRDYCIKVKDLPQYMAVASNASGSTPKELFEDVFEELEKQYHEDKTHIKDVLKLGKIVITSTSTFEDFKHSILEDMSSTSMSDVNIKLVFEELLDRIKEKEEKEAKKRQRLADEFTSLLRSLKEITVSSSWEDSKQLFEDSEEYSSIGEESRGRQIFEEYIAHLQDKAKEKERRREEEKAKKDKEREEKEKRKEKEKEKKDKERERERDKGKERQKKDDSESENVDTIESYDYKEDKRKEKDRKHRKRHQSIADDVNSDKDEKEEPKKSRKHGSDRKKSRKHGHTPESDNENRHKRHKRDSRDSSRRNGYEELEDGELGEDGEIQ